MFCVGICTTPDEEGGDVDMPVPSCIVEGSVSIAVLFVDRISAPLRQQDPDDLQMSLCGRSVERSVATFVFGIHRISPPKRQEDSQNADVPSHTSIVDRSVAIVVLLVHVCLFLDKLSHRGDVSFKARKVEWINFTPRHFCTRRGGGVCVGGG